MNLYKAQRKHQAKVKKLQERLARTKNQKGSGYNAKRKNIGQFFELQQKLQQHKECEPKHKKPQVFVDYLPAHYSHALDRYNDL